MAKSEEMAELIVMLKDAMSFSNKKNIVIDSWEFKASSQFTPGLLVLASMLVTARQFFGQPIKCDRNVRNTRCLIFFQHLYLNLVFNSFNFGINP